MVVFTHCAEYDRTDSICFSFQGERARVTGSKGVGKYKNCTDQELDLESYQGSVCGKYDFDRSILLLL